VGRTSAITLFAMMGLFFALFFVWPIAITVREAFVDGQGSFTLAFIGDVFQNPLYREGLVNSLKMGVFSTALAILLALPLAVLTDRYVFPGKVWFSSLILIPLMLPPFVGAIGIKHLLGKMGVFNTALMKLGIMDPSQPIDWLGESQLLGVVVMNALHLYPIVYLNVSAALANLDPAMEEAALNLGCGPFKRFWKITLPLTMPGLFAGATIVFIWAFTELGVPLMFDYGRVTSVQIFSGLKDLSGNPTPYALVVVMLAVAMFMFGLSKFLFGSKAHAVAGKASIGRQARHLGWLGATFCTVLFSLVTLVAVLPHLAVVLTSLSKDWYATLLPDSFSLAAYEEALGHPLTLLSIKNSLVYAGLATVVDVVLGVAIAYVVVRTTLPGRNWLDGMAMMPLAVPGLVLAFGFLAMTREGQFFHFLLLGENPILLLVIAYAVRRLPYVVRSAVAGFQQTSVTLEEAAQNLGASPFKALLKVTFPLISANIIAGGLLAFAFAMLEVSDSLILATKQAYFPITTAMYALFNALGNGEKLASALGVWAMVFLGITIIGASLILGKKMGALFRV
jgi:iron(III) transport system permease protein